MSNEEYDATRAVEQAWTEFRARLADRLAELEDAESLILEMETGVDDDEAARAAPYVQFLGWGEGLIRAEVVSNAYLDQRFRLEASDEDLLVALGWGAPTYGAGDEPDEGSENFFVDLELREADRLAVMAVRALREAFGCMHPSFLLVDGMEPDVPPAPESGLPVDREETVAFPRSAHELHELVHAALAAGLEGPIKVDEDGDFPFRAGRSVLFVQVPGDMPAVDLYAQLVHDVRDLERAALEVGLLNRSHPYARFHLRDDTVVMVYRVCASPFVPAQLRAVLGLLLDDVDDVARELAARVDGLRFLDPRRPAEAPATTPVPYALMRRDDANPVMIGLLEMLHVGPVPTATVAALFDHDRLELIRQIVWVRTGSQPCGSLDQELVLDHLRRALRLVADGQAAPEASPRPPRRVPRRRTQQLTLMPDPHDEQPALDVGRWDQEIS